MATRSLRQAHLRFQGNELILQPNSDSNDDSEVSEPVAKKRKCDYKIEWEEGREWLFYDDEKDGMFCKVCQHFDKKPRSGKAMWNTVPCTCIRAASVTRHEKSQLLNLVNLLDSDVLSHLNKGDNATYRSQRSISEFLTLISSNIRSSIKVELENSPFLGIMIDETTDLSTTKQLIFYVKYLVRPLLDDQTPLDGISVWTRFLGIRAQSC